MASMTAMASATPPKQTYANRIIAYAGAERRVGVLSGIGLKAGGTDNGPPRLRNIAEGHPPGYYAAFVLDPDGNNIEAVCREI
jgi:hypothetical protein